MTNSNAPGHVYLSVAEGKQFTTQQKDQIGEMIYSRFFYYDGLPVWKDDNCRKTKNQILTQVNQVIDVLQLKGHI